MTLAKRRNVVNAMFYRNFLSLNVSKKRFFSLLTRGAKQNAT